MPSKKERAGVEDLEKLGPRGLLQRDCQSLSRNDPLGDDVLQLVATLTEQDGECLQTQQGVLGEIRTHDPPLGSFGPVLPGGKPCSRWGLGLYWAAKWRLLSLPWSC